MSWEIYVHIFPNGKKYIGITSQTAERRWRSSGEGYKHQGYIYNAIMKYGWENIEHKIIKVVESQSEAEEAEQYYIKKFQTDKRKFGYNIRSGGNCSKGHKLRKETCEKMSKSRSGQNNWIYGKHLSDEVKAKLSAAHKGKCNIEAILKGAKKRMGANAYNARGVICLNLKGELIAEYNSMAEGARAQGIREQDIYSCCVGRQKSTHGTKWKYASENAD